ncbi:MAG TPA: HAMP domain-containing sensor histidine kinase [Polyangiaceae bacterium]|nr:HAMP domain-containing sensor histidine kinase [Polyangiaceae bacterium]
MADGPHRPLRERLLYFVLVPAICVAVMLLGAAALRTTLQIERASKQSVLDATSSLAEERVDRLDKMIIAQDNAVAANVEVRELSSIAARWLATAVRETPTVRAVLVLDADSADREVRAFVSRHPGPEDDVFRRLLVGRMLSKMELSEPIEQLRHLHQAFDEQSFLVSYWQRVHGGRKYLVVVWHEVAKLVHEIMPQLYRDLDRNSRMNVVDEEGRILFGPPLQAGAPAVSLQFPTTLYNWRLQVALASAEGLEQRTVRQRYVQLAVVGMAMLIAVVGVVIIVRASIQERRLAALQSDFVANVSHELKTPLSSVRMFAELLLTRRVPNDDKRKEYLQIIMGESERLSSLIDNVLDFAKVERGKDAYEFAEDDLAEVAARAVDSLRYRAERLGIELVTNLQPATIVFDARAVELAIINLIDNAFKYARGTPSVNVSVARTAAGGARVRVADEGPGIPREEQERIFDRFVRGRNASEAHVRGSGIGLALVKHIADTHGGSITIESPTASGRGSAFELELLDRPPKKRTRS